MNYFQYFSEIEECFTRRRGSVLLLSTLDWALIETWRDAGVPLAAVLRGIDDAFDKYEARAARAGSGKGRLRKVNGLAWCAQAVMAATEQMAEAGVGLANGTSPETSEAKATGFETERVARFLLANAQAVSAAPVPPGATAVRDETARRLRELAASPGHALDELDRTLTVLEERLVAALTTTASEATLVSLRGQADAALTAFRGKIGTVQLRQVRDQFLTRKLLAEFQIPRLSLFYMGLNSE